MATRNHFLQFLKSIWLFPVILTTILLLFTAFKISGSSLEIYDYILGVQQGKSLIVNQPQAIRSDEWLVATQMTLAQNANHYKQINKNIGNGQDMSFMEDVPYKDWSTIFKPENWAFFCIPFAHAFALKWWLMAYALALSCYFFVLTLLPGKKLWAALLAVCLLFSPFVQWWYQFDTLAPLYYCLIAGILFIHLVRSTSWQKKLLLTAGLAYVLTAFIFILYPPFMIACALGLLAFCVGYLLEYKHNHDWKQVGLVVCWVAGALAFAVTMVGLFILTRHAAVKAISDTVYPGMRAAPGGDYDVTKIFGGFMNTQLQNIKRANNYGLNQSENSNFILLTPFLLIPSAYLLIRKYRQSKIIDWPLLCVNIMFVILSARILTPFFDPLWKPLLLYKVPARRLLIGFGLINIVQLVLFIRNFKDFDATVRRWVKPLYLIAVLLTEVIFAAMTHHRYPGYISDYKALLLAVVVPIIIGLLLYKRFVWAIALFTIFTIYSSYMVVPLYHGTRPLTNTPISNTIQAIAAHSNGKWIAESVQYENLAIMNGAPSLSGVFDYPQPEIWKNVAPRDPDIYNRYAHIIAVIDHSGQANFKTHLQKVQDDTYVVVSEPCSAFFKQQNVRYILAQAPITNSCVSLKAEVPYPNQTFFIYQINYHQVVASR
jgi:hypothetical protein